MKTINLKLVKASPIAIEFDNVLPELLYDKTYEEIENTIVYHGNREEKLGDSFEIGIDGTCDGADDCTIIIDGDLSRVKRIGYCMNNGHIIANGDVDFHVGACMSGGHITVNGNAESYAGREMTGGLLEIKGDVKEFCGASYAGDWRGMSGGKIIVSGNAGKQLAEYMMGGEIIVKGDCDILAGVHMSGGLLLVEGNADKWAGGQMKNGTIIVNGQSGELLPTFSLQETVHNPMINGKYYVGRYGIYSGDRGVNGKGKLWIKK
ncbi:MAG: formylmethanofuran dehydrogenase subunit C [Methanosphaera sp. rholeuAM270]|nr:MAG: formylmethanofuran dehydrogenase subunit C [Methanosphaera sp. rholeuAM270]